MPTAGGTHGQRKSAGSLPSPSAQSWRWRRVFSGEARELALLRRWLSSLLPECPARDDVLSVATELGGNALEHTASGQDSGWFAVEVTWHPPTVQIAVADCGGSAEPKVISDPDGERGRGLLLVQGLSRRSGWTGDVRGRLVWAQIAWDGQGLAAPGFSEDLYQVSVREGEEALARRFAGVPAWFGRSTLAWWAVAGPAGLVSAPTAHELAGLLHRLLETRSSARSPAAGQARDTSGEQLAHHLHRQRGAAGRDPARGQRPGTARTGSDDCRRGHAAHSRCLVMAPAVVAAGAA
jgi:anti-sigma regulatory factor (Ser/Thr protein kinase)